MPDTVIVTIRHGINEKDFELPAKLAIVMWIDSLRDMLRKAFPGIMLDGKKVKLTYANQLLGEEGTLEAYGIYDGSYIGLLLEG